MIMPHLFSLLLIKKNLQFVEICNTLCLNIHIKTEKRGTLRMDIIIYDDDKAFLKIMQDTFAKLRVKHSGVFSELSYFSNKDDIMTYIDANDRTSLYILDIMTGKTQTGYEIANYIKSVNNENLIIYVTDFKDEIMSNIRHKLLSISFILKDSINFFEEIEVSILTANDLLSGQYFTYKSSREVFNVKYDDIYYFGKKKNTDYTYIVHRNGRFSIRCSLREIKNKLPDWFCFSTKEYIVNTRAITHLDNENKIVHFAKDINCPYSRYQKKELLKWTSI